MDVISDFLLIDRDFFVTDFNLSEEEIMSDLTY